MPSPAEIMHGDRPRFYQSSGRVPLVGIFLTFVIGLIWGIGIASSYAYADYYTPLVYANVILVALYGLAVGFVTAWGARLGKVRNLKQTERVTIVVATVSYLASWIFWLYVIADSGRDQVAFCWMLSHPASFFRTLAWVYDHGTWSVGSHLEYAMGSIPAVNGPFLVAVWIGEAVTFFAAAIVTVRLRFDARPFCEACGSWCDPPQMLHTYRGGLSAAGVKLRLESRGWEYLSQLPASRYRDTTRIELSSESCGKCGKTHLLSLRRATTITDRQAKRSTTRITVMQRLIITRDELETIRSIAPAEPDASTA